MKENDNENLLDALLQSVARFIGKYYNPGVSSETGKVSDSSQEGVWKGKSESQEDSHAAWRMELRNGEPVLVPAEGEKSRSVSVVPESQIHGAEAAAAQVKEPFNALLLRLIDEKGHTDAEIYHRAHIDRKLFSKIRTNADYTPGRRTVIALALALELDMDETNAFLQRAGLALSPGSKADLIVGYCILHQIYDIDTVNLLLDHFGQQGLG